MSARLPCDILKKRVIDTGLCTRCGTCVGACPAGNLSIPDPLGDCLPEAGDSCTSCGLCLDSCPGETVEFGPLERELFGAGVEGDPLLGVIRKTYLARAEDSACRSAGSSGGVVTALLVDLTRRGEIGGALLYAPDGKEPWRGTGRIVTGVEDIVRAAQSRYHLSPMNTALRELLSGGTNDAAESSRDFGSGKPDDAGAAPGDFSSGGPEGSTADRIAYVGLGCHVHGLRKLLAREPAGGGRLGPVIGLYCGNNLYYEATRVMCRKLGVKDFDAVRSISYREGTWPGSFAVRTAGGAVRMISKLDFNQVIPFYVNRRCLFCIDLTNELADLSVGDGWAKEENGGDGWSVVLERTQRGAGILERAAASGAVHLEEIDLEDARRMHSHAFDLKKRGAFLRLGLWRRWGFTVPRYDRAAPAVKAGRKAAEIIVSLQFLLSSSRAGRAVFGILPVRLIGAVFRGLRKVWIVGTRQSS